MNSSRLSECFWAVRWMPFEYLLDSRPFATLGILSRPFAAFVAFAAFAVKDVFLEVRLDMTRCLGRSADFQVCFRLRKRCLLSRLGSERNERSDTLRYERGGASYQVRS
jgi:hypothetical protein